MTHIDHVHSTYHGHSMYPTLLAWKNGRFMEIYITRNMDEIYSRERLVGFNGFKRDYQKTTLGENARFFGRLLLGAVVEGVIEGIRR